MCKIAQGGIVMFRFDRRTIMSLTADEVRVASCLQKAADEAKEAAELVRKTYRCFGIGEEKIEIWHDSERNNFEYLTYTGVWQARYQNYACEVECSEDEIFKCFKAEYLLENGFVRECDIGFSAEERELKRTCEYFRKFLENTRAKYEQLNLEQQDND